MPILHQAPGRPRPHTRLVVAVGKPLLGNRNACKAWRSPARRWPSAGRRPSPTADIRVPALSSRTAGREAASSPNGRPSGAGSVGVQPARATGTKPVNMSPDLGNRTCFTSGPLAGRSPMTRWTICRFVQDLLTSHRRLRSWVVYPKGIYPMIARLGIEVIPVVVRHSSASILESN